MKFAGKSIIGKKRAKKGFEYPIIRFPKEYLELIGKEAKIYEIDKNKFLISIDENSEDKLPNQLDNSYTLVKIDKNLLQKAKELEINISSYIEGKLRELLENLNLSQGPDSNRGQGICSPPHGPSATLAYV